MATTGHECTEPGAPEAARGPSLLPAAPVAKPWWLEPYGEVEGIALLHHSSGWKALRAPLMGKVSAQHKLAAIVSH